VNAPSHPRAFDLNGNAIDPLQCVVPIVRPCGHRQLRVVGTGFYLTRYGLLATAAHVVRDLAAGSELGPAHVFHPGPPGQVYMRRIVGASVIDDLDVAACFAENYAGTFPEQPLGNFRGCVSIEPPGAGVRMVSYAYPQNATLDFRDPEAQPLIRGDYYEGNVSALIDETEAAARRISGEYFPQRLRLPLIETSLAMQGGASGAPVCGPRGRIVGMFSRGFGADPPSYVVPIAQLLPLRVTLKHIPDISWEFQQIPEHRRGGQATIGELATWGHVSLMEAGQT
jgi:Trypsin-like peptidase domain